MQDASKPIWFKKEEQTNTDLKNNISIMVCTPVHSEVSMHYTQALLEFQKVCMLKGIIVSFTILKSSLGTVKSQYKPCLLAIPSNIYTVFIEKENPRQ